MIVNNSIDIDEIVAEYGLADHLTELDEVGLTVVSQETLRLSDEWIDRLRDALLRLGEARLCLLQPCNGSVGKY